MKSVGVLGGGQLGYMLAEAANNMGVEITILDEGQTPAKRNAKSINGSFKDPVKISELSKSCDILTIEIEHVDTRALETISESVVVQPSVSAIRTIQDKFLQKTHLLSGGVCLGPFMDIESKNTDEIIEECRRIAIQFGYPFMLKSKTMAYDGKGNSVVKSFDDIKPAVEQMTKGGKGIYAEKWVTFKKELAGNLHLY